MENFFAEKVNPLNFSNKQTNKQTNKKLIHRYLTGSMLYSTYIFCLKDTHFSKNAIYHRKHKNMRYCIYMRYYNWNRRKLKLRYRSIGRTWRGPLVLGLTVIEIFKADWCSQIFSKFVGVFWHKIRPLIHILILNLFGILQLDERKFARYS